MTVEYYYYYSILYHTYIRTVHTTVYTILVSMRVVVESRHCIVPHRVACHWHTDSDFAGFISTALDVSTVAVPVLPSSRATTTL